MLIQNILHGLHICRRSHKAMSYEINIFINGQQDVALILLGEGWQIDMFARHIDALMSAQHTVVLHGGINRGTHNIHDNHIEQAIIDEDMVTHLHVASEIFIIHIDDVVGGIHLRPTEDLHHITCFISDFLLDIGRSDLRALGVNENSNMRRNGTHIANDITNTILSSVSRVHPDYIHTSEEEFSQKIHITTAITDGTYNLSLFHNFDPI